MQKTQWFNKPLGFLHPGLQERRAQSRDERTTKLKLLTVPSLPESLLVVHPERSPKLLDRLNLGSHHQTSR